MNRAFVLACAVTMFAQASFAQTKTKNETMEGVITISGAWALYPMAVKWAEEFRKLYPNVKIDISAGGAGKGMADCLANVSDLGMVSRDVNSEEVKKGAWALAVVKDAVVPTINANNPLIEKVLAQGINKKQFENIFMTGSLKTWGELTNTDSKAAINTYTRSDACGAAETWAKYLGKKQEDLLGIGVYGDPGVAEAVKKDKLGIGYNNINYAYDAKTKKPIEGIRVVPIDLNEDGRIDPKENFYLTRDEIATAIADGRYPSPPARELYFVSHGKPSQKIVQEFIHWVLTEGQQFVFETGYINLKPEKLDADLKQLEAK